MDPCESRWLDDLEVKLDFLDSAIHGTSDFDSQESAKFLDIVVEVQQLTRDLTALQPRMEGYNENGLLNRAHIVLQNAMIKLEVHFVQLLEAHGRFTEPSFMPFHSENVHPYDFSINSPEEESMQAGLQRDEAYDSEEYLIEWIPSYAVHYISRIATILFMANYDMECCQSYIACRKNALDECLSFFWVEKLSITDVLRMKWEFLDKKISRWTKVMKVFIRVYLVSEKRLCDQIFGGLLNSRSLDCFFESAKGSIMQLLYFAEAIALGTPSLDKLFRVSEIYSTLCDLLPDMELLNLKDSGFCAVTECRDILNRLSGCSRGILMMLKDGIRTESKPITDRGELHPLTRYAMNYFWNMVAYKDLIPMVFGNTNNDNLHGSLNGLDEEDSDNTSSLAAAYITEVLLLLEKNLEAKSMLCCDISLRHVFMLNNIQYMVRKVRDQPKLEHLLGEGWVKNHMVKYRKHEKLYERETWARVISLLVEEGATNNFYGKEKKIKDKFKKFNHAFEEVYKVQTAWVIPNEKLRVELRMSISNNLVQAYRWFFGWGGPHLDRIGRHERYIKYTPEDLDRYVYDLFEGSSKSLPSHH